MNAVARSRPSNAAHNYRSSSIGGEPARPMTTVMRRLTAAAMAIATRSSLHHAPPPLYPAADPIWQSQRPRRSRSPTPLKSHSTARCTVVPMPARGFLPRGLSDACPPSAPHCQVTGRHLITLNDSSRSPIRIYRPAPTPDRSLDHLCIYASLCGNVREKSARPSAGSRPRGCR
jgi:hypothetical protein